MALLARDPYSVTAVPRTDIAGLRQLIVPCWRDVRRALEVVGWSVWMDPAAKASRAKDRALGIAARSMDIAVEQTRIVLRRMVAKLDLALAGDMNGWVRMRIEK